MCPQIIEFARRHKGKFAGRILEVGSLNVNGTIREVIPVTIGTDMRAGPDVDQVVTAYGLMEHYGLESFDGVVSCDALEHIQDWEAALVNMWGVLKPGGPMLLTMANPKKGRHAYPDDYWRWQLPDFLRLFADNQILGSFQDGPSMGAVVVKTGPLDLTIKPTPVP